MRILVTGASGWIGSATTAELLRNGHEVVGLARSDASADAITALGATVVRGGLDDPAGLAAAAKDVDGVVHLAYNHDFSAMTEAAATDRQAIEAIGEALAGTGGPFLIASGVVGLAHGRPGTEEDAPDPSLHPRVANAVRTVELADSGIRSGVVRFAPTVHGPGDHGFIATIVGIARDKGVSAYVGDGTSRWPAVHRLDAARLVALAVDSAPAGAVVHAVAEEGVPAKAIAEAIGAGLGLPVTSVAPDDAMEHFGWMGRFFGADLPTSNALTRERLGWEPTHATLLEDLASGSYFA